MVRKKLINGMEHEARDFAPLKEPWSEYWIERDGIRLRIKLVLVDVSVAPGKLDGAGRPVVNYSTTLVAVADKLDDDDRPPVVSA